MPNTYTYLVVNSKTNFQIIRLMVRAEQKENTTWCSKALCKSPYVLIAARKNPRRFELLPLIVENWCASVLRSNSRIYNLMGPRGVVINLMRSKEFERK